MLATLRLALAPLFGAVVATSLASAQCPVPDGLDGGPCCTTVKGNVPRFPKVDQSAFQICWRECDVEQFSTCRAEWINPFPTIVPHPAVPGAGGNACQPRFVWFRLSDAATGDVKWRGSLRLTYSRTWQETKPSGDNLQVWRYLVNGDLSPTPSAGLTPCPVPPCAASTGNKVRYTGYIDYARSCTTGTYESAWMLTHSCDSLEHVAGFPRGGFFHPNRAYTLVGPSGSFAIGPIQPIASGGTADEAIRRIRLAAGAAPRCEYEELIDSGLEVEQELCICSLPTSPSQYAISDLGLASSCGSEIFTPGGPDLPGYVSMGIGAWTDPAAYPGLETLRWTTGGYDYFDPCKGETRQEVFYGVTTLGGFAASRVLSIGSGFPLSETFVDQVNSLDAAEDTVMNVPFQSDHVVNLNFD